MTTKDLGAGTIWDLFSFILLSAQRCNTPTCQAQESSSAPATGDSQSHVLLCPARITRQHCVSTEAWSHDKKSPVYSEHVCTTRPDRCAAIVWEFRSGKNLDFF